MNFRKYQHLEKFGTTEVESIEFGDCYIFPKMDGTNASVWLGDDGVVQAGSRTRTLSLEKDNAGFYEWVTKQENILNFLKANPNKRLYGEWLVPHSLKTYKDSAWKRFYVFDVTEEDGENFRYMHYDEYKPLMDLYEFDYIPPISIIKNASYERLIHQLSNNVFMIEDGKGVGEGIVVKNYSFVNRFGRTTWAKIVTSEFKEKHSKAMGAPEIKEKSLVEESIADEFVTKALCEKVYAKIENENGFSSRDIPRLLNTVFYDVVKEDMWEIIKKHKNPTINFNTLKHFVFTRVKSNFPNIF